MSYYTGIDVGSLTTDVVIIDSQDAIVGHAIVPTGAHSTAAAEEALRKALTMAGLEWAAIRFSVGTGYGRVSLPYADKEVTEISCHGTGAHHLFPDVSTVIDIGGQDSKVIRVNRQGKILDFVMNDKCAAGTGRFLEVMAQKLGLTLDELGDLSAMARSAVTISSVCTVFAESEVVSLVAKNHPVDEIVKGLHSAIVNRVWSMFKSAGGDGKVTMTGGVAKNRGVVALFEEKLGSPISIHEDPQIVGAYGAALIAKKEAQRGAAVTGDRMRTLP